jgi:hypothetical protein
MIYGSSSLTNIGIGTATGPTGFDGVTGISGPIGPIGASGPTGDTGPSVLNMTTITEGDKVGNIATEYDDGFVATAVNILRGNTGNYYLNVDADVLSSGFNIIHGVSLEYSDGDAYPQTILRFKGITTNSPTTITISKTTDNTAVVLNYSLFNLANLTVSDANFVNNSILYNAPGDNTLSILGSEYNPEINSARIQLGNYSERLQIVNAESVPVGTIQTQRVYYWNIDWENVNVIKLNPYDSTGQTVVAQMLNIRSPNNEMASKGMTIIIPSGITSSQTYSTIYRTTDDLSTPITINDIEDIETNESGVSWPLSIPPCFTQHIDVLNLISIGDVWHADFSHLGITYKESEQDYQGINTVNKIPSKISITEELYKCADGSNVFGLCCPDICGADPYETIEVLCNGIFYPGLTLTQCNDQCKAVGVCCLFNDANGTDFKIPDFVQYCECQSFATQGGYASFIWTERTSASQTVDDINCENATNKIGACCDGKGNCTQTTQEDCTGSYLGDGEPCVLVDGTPQCGGGGNTTETGACCTSVTSTCTDNVTFEECFNSNGLYLGNNTSCAEFQCIASCLESVPPSFPNDPIVIPPLAIGDEIAGGIVVGIFNPNNSLCYGDPRFGGIPPNLLSGLSEEEVLQSEEIFNFLNNGDEKPAEVYRTKYYQNGYGFNRAANHACDDDTWILIVSKNPVMLSENENPFNATDITGTNIDDNRLLKTFTWSHGGTYFGNIMTDDGFVPGNTETSTEQFNGDTTPDEGWFTYKNPGITHYGNLYSFTQCSNVNNDNPIYRSGHGYFRARTTFNGKWSTNWGIYNTIRMVCAERHAYNVDPGYPDNFKERYDFGPGFSTIYTSWVQSQQSSSEAISAYNNNSSNTGIYYPKMSNWYIPSIDELGFIAHNIAFINGSIIANSGIPIGDTRIGADGWVWSSTGTFDEGITFEHTQINNPEGQPVEGQPVFPVPHGTEACAIKITPQSEVFYKKANRLDRYEVRPVRMIRCDGQYYPIPPASNPARFYRFWKIPNLSINNIINGPS